MWRSISSHVKKYLLSCEEVYLIMSSSNASHVKKYIYLCREVFLSCDTVFWVIAGLHVGMWNSVSNYVKSVSSHVKYIYWCQEVFLVIWRNILSLCRIISRHVKKYFQLCQEVFLVTWRSILSHCRIVSRHVNQAFLVVWGSFSMVHVRLEVGSFCCMYNETVFAMYRTREL